MFWKRGKECLGTSVDFGRDWLVYRRDGREMTVTVDVGAGEAVVFTDTVGRWDDAPDVRAGETEREQILRDIEIELSNRGLKVKVVP